MKIRRAGKKDEGSEHVFPGLRGGELNGDYVGKKFKAPATLRKLARNCTM